MTEANRKRIGWSLAGVLGVALLVAAIAVAPMQGVQSDGDRHSDGARCAGRRAGRRARERRAQADARADAGGAVGRRSDADSFDRGHRNAGQSGRCRGRVRSRASRKNVSRRQSRSSTQAEQEIVKLRADAVVQRAQDEVTLLTARFDVRRAELDVQGSLLSSAIDKQKFVLTLEEAKARLAQLAERPAVARRHRSRLAGGARGEAQQGAGSRWTTRRRTSTT